MRLDKFLATLQLGTRSEVKSYIKKGFVSVNGTCIKQTDYAVKEESDLVICQGKPVVYEPFVYYMLHKPAGVVSTTEDGACTTVVDLLKAEHRKDLFPVGRLDKDTEGLLLLTNDGVLAHELLSPKKHVEKTYYATINGVVSQTEVDRFKEGLSIGEKKDTLPAKLSILSIEEKDGIVQSEVLVTITEGKFHQIKRMFHAVGMEVVYLKRISMGNLVLDEALPCGSYKKITKKEICLDEKEDCSC